MRRIEIATRVLAVAQVIVCVLAAVFACAACRRLNLGLVGAGYYSFLLFALLRRWDGVANLMLCFAVSAHAALLARMASDGGACAFCIAAALGAATLAALRALQFHGMLRAVAIYLLPLSLAASAIIGWVSPPLRPDKLLEGIPADGPLKANAPAAVTMAVYENPNCPYCERFRREVVPVVEAIFREQVAIRFMDGRDNPGVRVTPTIVLAGTGDPIVVEGLPRPDMLVRQIQRLVSTK